MPGDQVEEIQRRFRDCFGPVGPTGIVRAPGRINLIGEHLDYNGLPVLPMALERGISLAFRSRPDTRIRLINLDPAHPPIDDSFRDRASSARRGDWSDFVRIARESLALRCGDIRGFDGVLATNLPIAAGLSSSTALVVAVAKALLSVNGIRIERLALIECLAAGERRVGAPGGAMDQAACVAGRPRTALKVEFDPLRLTPIPLPEGWRFIVAHSLVQADKSGPAEQACRTRIAECAEALRVLQSVGIAGSDSYTTLARTYEYGDILKAAQPVLNVALLRRLRHVLTESHRVREAETMLRNQDIAGFGRLVHDSHRSLRDDFAVSHPALDRLVEIAHANGAAGARLTGAGFGGCIIALCERGAAPSLLHAFRREYYANLAQGEQDQVLFEA